MGLTEDVRKLIENNAILLKEKNHESLSDNHKRNYADGVLQHIELYIAPKKGIYKIDPLREFASGFIPEKIKPLDERLFAEPTEGHYMQFGKITFKEKIANGLITTRITLLDGEEFENFKKVSATTVDYFRKIDLHLFPSEEIGRYLIDNNITRQDMMEYRHLKDFMPKKSFLEKVLNGH